MECRKFDNDDNQNDLHKEYKRSMEGAKSEYLTRRLMENYNVDRAHTISELHINHGNMKKAGDACM